MHVSLVTMPYKDPEKRREFKKRWREKNRETLRAKQRQRKRVRDVCVRDLRVVLTPLTRDECQVPVERLQRRKAVTRDVECRACAERDRVKVERVQEAKRRKREQNRAWKKANREKVREYKRQWRANNREKVREWKRTWYQNKREKVREQKRQWRENNREKDRELQRRQRQVDPEKTKEREQTWYQNNRERVLERKRQWRKDNPEKVRAQGKRRRERLRNDEARMRVVRERRREQNQRYREAHREKVRAQHKRWRQANPEKLKAKRKRHREAENARGRRYHAARREERNRAKRERYYKQRGRPVPPLTPPPCDCGLCVACGGWGAIWKPAWHARLKAFCPPQDPSTPAPTLEELPMDLPESEAETETLSHASTSEIESELGDRLDSLLMDESDSEVETREKVEAPTRRFRRIAAMPSVSYKDWDEEEKLVSEFLRRKAQLHADGVDRIVARWELLDHRTERVDAIVEEMSMGMDPMHQLDRFHHQLERQDYVLDVMVSEDLLDFVDAQLA